MSVNLTAAREQQPPFYGRFIGRSTCVSWHLQLRTVGAMFYYLNTWQTVHLDLGEYAGVLNSVFYTVSIPYCQENVQEEILSGKLSIVYFKFGARSFVIV